MAGETRMLGWLSRLIAALLLTLGLSRVHRIAPGVYELLLGPCAPDAFTDRTALVLACPGRDLLRVWPCPVAIRPAHQAC